MVYQTFDQQHYGSKLGIERGKVSRGKTSTNIKSDRIYGQQQDARRPKPSIKQRPESDVYSSLVIESSQKRASSTKKHLTSQSSHSHYRSVADASILSQK